MLIFLRLFQLVVFSAVCFSTTSFAKEQRIVALAPHIVEMLFELGVGEQIVGTVDYADYPKAALKIPRVGGYYGIQVEKILALKPDIVIVWQSGNKASDIAQLKKMGLNIIYSQAKNLDEVGPEILKLGVAIGHEAQAKRVASAYNQKLEKLRNQYVDKTPMKVFYQLWPEPMRTVNKTTLIHQLMKVCQGSNVFAQSSAAYPQIGIENVIVAQPDIIILPDEKSDVEQPIIDWSKWPEVPAAKHNRFIRVNADLMHRVSIRMLDGVEDMCKKIHSYR